MEHTRYTRDIVDIKGSKKKTLDVPASGECIIIRNTTAMPIASIILEGGTRNDKAPRAVPISVAMPALSPEMFS